MRSLPILGDNTSLPRDAVTSRMEMLLVSFFISCRKTCFKGAKQEEFSSSFPGYLFVFEKRLF